MFRDDPVLGCVRLCSTCGDEWPFDAEFWHMRDGGLNPAWPARCIACCADYYASRRRLLMGVVKAERVFLVPDKDRCGAPMRFGRSCGRRPGHDYSHRSIEACQSDSGRTRHRRDRQPMAVA